MLQSAYCGPAAAACAAYGNYELARANGVPAKYARKIGGLAGIRAWLFPSQPLNLGQGNGGIIYNFTGEGEDGGNGGGANPFQILAGGEIDASMERNFAKTEEVANGEIQIDTVSTTMTETTGNKFANGASQRAFMETAKASNSSGKSNSQKSNENKQDNEMQARVALGVSGTIFDTVTGGRAAFLIGVDGEGKACFQAKMCALLGAGLEGSMGGTVQLGNKNFTEGENELVNGVFVKGGSGPVGGAFVSDDGSVTIDIGAGGGGAAGITSCLITTRCIGGD